MDNANVPPQPSKSHTNQWQCDPGPTQNLYQVQVDVINNPSQQTANKTSSIPSSNCDKTTNNSNIKEGQYKGQGCQENVAGHGNAADHTLQAEPLNKDFKNDKLQGQRPERGMLNPERCHFYLQRKRRYCRTIPPKGQTICVEHSAGTSEATRTRIKCPLDPKHTCYEDQLKSHLKKCNARPDALPVYYVQNLNSGLIEDGEWIKVSVTTAESDELTLMVAKVNALYEEKIGTLKTEILSHTALQEEIEKPTNGAAALKHLKQQASLVGHVEKRGLLHDGCCYIEFGAGKAGLSHWVQRALPLCDDTKFVIVDKSSVRYKMDVYHRADNQGPDFERLRIDIEHLDLNKVPSLFVNHRPLVGLGKHLCGGATDLMLRCLMQTVRETNKANSSKTPFVEGLVLALCCHHRCDWKTFVGKQIMRDWGVGPREFTLMTSMTSWATCATQTFLDKLKEREQETESVGSHQEEGDPAEPDQPYNHPRYGSMTPEYREEVGFKCKKLIDMARVHYLREYDFDAQLLVYADLAHTLENVVLVARNTIQANPADEPKKTDDATTTS